MLKPSADPALSAAFTIPKLPEGFARRPRLAKLVTDGLRRPLRVVNGRAGAGKSLDRPVLRRLAG